MSIDPITISSGIVMALRAIPLGGGRRKVGASLLRAKELRLLELAKDMRATAEQGEFLGPGALRMLAFVLEDHAAGLDAVADMLTKEDD